MNYIQRKTNVKQHDRRTKHKIANVKNHQRNIKMKQQLGVIALNNMTYKQAKKTFPKLKAYGDIDRDGVANKRDCRPFDTSRQDEYDDASKADEEYYRNQEIRDWGIERNKIARERSRQIETQSADELLRSL